MIKTVMFTDIEASTELAHRLGDVQAHKLTRLHNIVVRRAIRQHNGIEIKHTGDGILVTFAAASSAVDCGITICHSLARYLSGEYRDLKVNIGINAGEPIMDGHDVFGVAVQIAARLCSAATGGEILVSEVIKLLLAGKRYKFSNPRRLTLKGVTDPLVVYGVEWRAPSGLLAL